MCSFHLQQTQMIKASAQGAFDDNPDLDVTDVDMGAGGRIKGGSRSQISKTVGITKTQAKMNSSQFLLTEKAKSILQLIGVDPDTRIDPKVTLLNTVDTAWKQARIWEAMLASIPEGDWAYVGMLPIPGLRETSKGARIEIIQKNLAEATKNAAKVSKMAVDAGIEERLVRLAEEQSALIADTVRAAVISAIGALRLSPQAEKAAIETALGQAANRLRMLAAGDLPNPEPMIIEGTTRPVRPQRVKDRAHA